MAYKPTDVKRKKQSLGVWGPSEPDLGDSCGQGERCVRGWLVGLVWASHQPCEEQSEKFFGAGVSGGGPRTRGPEGQRARDRYLAGT